MSKFFLVPLFFAVAIASEERLLFASFGKTLTYYKFTSASTTVSHTPFCYTIAPLISVPTTLTTITTSLGAPLNCRRRRWAYENPIDGELVEISAGNPAAVTLAEATQLPDLRTVETSDDGETYMIDASINTESFERASPEERFVKVGISTVKTTMTLFTTITNNAATRTFTIGCTPQGATLTQC
ncbi:uncharacterized protein LOC136032713 [Artemia franciscana]|uniref:Uncharacterized protein n=1 Tax=Artemia franciscana TaxID=6661 RepID=A0AA88IAX5_ARTSF|nr:hypothetical protein QYM36_001263 [Artemia franciscana]